VRITRTLRRNTVLEINMREQATRPLVQTPDQPEDSAPRSRSAGPRLSAGLPGPCCAEPHAEIQVHFDDGRLRPDPVAQLARLARMPRRRFSKMDSKPTKLTIMNSLARVER
jgi:hypothetical protein